MANKKYLSDLENVILKKFEEQKDKISEELDVFSKSKSNYRLLELNDELVLCINKTSNNKSEYSKMHIGFPFPIYTLPNKIETDKGIIANIFLRGEIVRSKQREFLFKKGSVRKFSTPDKIQEKVKEDFRDAENLVYIDPYNFIGDSFIGLYYPDIFVKQFKIKNVEVFTNSHKDLSAEYAVKPKELNEIIGSIRKNKYCIITDPLDSTWGFTEKLLSLLDCDANIVIPGRNIYATKKEGELKFYWYEKPDVLLKNSNIECYMNETLLPFIEKPCVENNKTSLNKGTVYINPFGSREQKTIPLELAVNIFEELKSKGLECIILGGFSDKKEHKKWIYDFSKKVSFCEVKYYENLVELKKDFKENKCGCVITADTSITHLANREGLPNITLYNSVLWDTKSVQSLSSDSPLGFCRYYPNNIPVLVNGNYSREFAKNIVEAVLFFDKSLLFDEFIKTPSDMESYEKNISKLPKELNWVKEIYNPMILLKDVLHLKGADRLIESAIKISPLYKISSMWRLV